MDFYAHFSPKSLDVTANRPEFEEIGGTNRGTEMGTSRVEINGDIVTAALREAAKGQSEIHDFADTRTPGLVLRVRGNSASWLFKTRARSKKLGEPPRLGIREARRLAELARSEHATREKETPQTEAPVTWTWGELSERFLVRLANPRIRRGSVRQPSESTVSDARLAFSRPALAPWRDRTVASLTTTDLSDAVQDVIETVTYRQACKVLAYFKGAMTWALSNSPRESGLGSIVPWWQSIRPPEPTGEQLTRFIASIRPTAVEKFGPKEVATMLARHEDFCRARRGGPSRISPAVRWGLWWAAITVVRRGAATRLSALDVKWSDPRLPEGWAMATWPADVMKTKREFWLPIPPFGVTLLRSVQKEWRSAVNISHGAAHKTNWLFPSNRRIGRKDTTNDVPLSPFSLSTHLSNLRGKRLANHQNHLKDLPHFSLHSLRSAAATYLVERQDIADGAASALLGHTLPGDSDPQIVRLSPTTAAYYNLAQHVPLKMAAINAWTEAILDEYKKIGGVPPT